MAEGKKTFIFYSDWINMVREMPNEDAGALLKHILAYVNDEDPVSENILVKMAFGHMKPMLKSDLDKWDLIRQKRKKAGRKGGQANAKQNEANAKQLEAVNVNVNDNVNVNEILLKKETKKRENFKPPTIEKIKSHAQESKYQNFDSEVFFNFYESKGWMVGKSKMKNWKSAMAGWHARNKNKSNGNNQKPSTLGTHRLGTDWDEKM